MYYFLNALIYIIVFFMGAVVFSYLNLIIERLPKKENILVRHTKCPHCEHEQNIKDVFPIISSIVHKGRCRYCLEKLSERATAIEILGGVCSIGSILIYGITLKALFLFLVICDLVVISFIDLDTQEIPPQLNIVMLALGVISIFVMDGPGIVERLIGVVAVSLPMFLLAVLFNGFGGGDVKLMAAAGLLLGWKGIVVAFFIGAILGGVYGVYLLASKKMGRKGYFAFGPYLCVGILVSFINGIGAMLVNMYIDYIKSFQTMMMLF